MSDMNSVCLIGRLTGDADSKETRSGRYKMAFTVAVNRRVRDDMEGWKDEASFVDVEYWAKTDNLSQWLRKGRQVAVQGELRQDRWIDGATQQRRSKLFVAAKDVSLTGSRGDDQPAPRQEDASTYPSTVPQGIRTPEQEHEAEQVPAAGRGEATARYEVPRDGRDRTPAPEVKDDFADSNDPDGQQTLTGDGIPF